MQTASSFLELAHVTVIRSGRTVLDNINLAIQVGEQVALLGPNGCGKSTLLKTIACELYPLANKDTQVSLFGRSRWDLTELKRRLGVVQNELPGKPILATTGRNALLTGFFSSSMLWPHLIVTTKMLQRADEVLEQVGAVELADRLFGEMSAGQQRRILIGRALVASAGCLLLDEPSNALDLSAQQSLRELLIELAEQHTTILLVTHHVADIIPAMRRVVLMAEGRIVADGKREEVLTEPLLSRLFQCKIHLRKQEGFYQAW